MTALLAPGGCSGESTGVPDEQLGGLVIPTSQSRRAVDVQRVHTDPDELVHAALMPHDAVARQLGAHRYRSEARVVIRDARDGTAEDALPLETLNIETRIEITDAGDYRAVSENSREYGREVVFVGGFLYLAPRYSRFHRRAPEHSTEPARIRSDMYGDLGAHLELVRRAIELQDTVGKAQTTTGRRIHSVEITKAPNVRPAATRERLTHRTWRDNIIVRDVNGELSVDVETGIVLHASLHGAVTFQRDARQFVMTFDVDHEIDDIGARIDVAAPADDRWVSTPLRSREVTERDQLLNGIAPPTRKSTPRTPANLSPPTTSKGKKP